VHLDRISERVTELDPEPQLDLSSIASVRGLSTAYGIGSDPLEGVVQLIEDEFVCCGDGLRGWPYGVDPALLFRDGCGIRILQAAKHCSIPRAGLRVATRAGSRRFKGHRSRVLAAQQSFGRIAEDHSASSDLRRRELSFAHQLVDRASADAVSFGAVVHAKGAALNWGDIRF
jgi:hypothetical protein